MTYYEKHTTRAKKYAKKYYKKNKQAVKEFMRAYRKAHKEHISEYNHEYYLRVTKQKRIDKKAQNLLQKA